MMKEQEKQAREEPFKTKGSKLLPPLRLFKQYQKWQSIFKFC